MIAQDRARAGRTLQSPASRVYISAMVAGLAASSLVGCAHNPFSAHQPPEQTTVEQRAALASVEIDSANVFGEWRREDFLGEAQEIELPQVWLSEAWESTAQAEARRAAAQASRVQADAARSSSTARADATQRAAFSSRDIGHANAGKLRTVLDAKLAEMQARTMATHHANTTETSRNDKLLDAAVKEWQSEVDKIRAGAISGWEQAQAEYERMVAQRGAVADRGVAQIQQMTRVADLTQRRADAKVRALRQEAETVGEQTHAHRDDLAQQIRSLGERTRATVSELRQKARSTDQEGRARGDELRARATAIEEQDVEETYRLHLSAAESAYNEAQAESQRLFETADALEDNLQAEVTRRMSEAAQLYEIDRTDFEEALSAIDAYLEHGKADIALLRVNADRIEKQARAEFVKAEAAGRAAAIRETSRHQFQLAEEESDRINAEAQAQAARVQADFFAVLAKQRAKGKVTYPGLTDEKSPDATSGDGTPEFTEAIQAGERLDPGHVAAFKTALAEVSKLRMQADAQEREMFATAEQRRVSFDAWWDQRQAAHEASVAEAKAFERQTRAEIDQYLAQAESMLKQATAKLGKSTMEAEAFRRESTAQITNLRAEAASLTKKTQARVSQLTAQANASERNGESELRSLEVSLESSQRKGEATIARLVAEADALEVSQGAVVEQMRQEISAAQRILDSELAKLDQASESFIQVAEATYNEELARVAMLERVNEATFVELNAGNEAQAQIHAAEVAYQRDVATANELIAQAAVERAVANADAEFGFDQARDALVRAQIITEAEIADATVEEQFFIADAEDRATRALFDSRVIETVAQRDHAYAEQYLDNQQTELRLQQALAAAAAYHELSQAAVTRLDEQTDAFNTAAQDNWFSELATPTAMPTPDSVQGLKVFAQRAFDAGSGAGYNGENFRQPGPSFEGRWFIDNTEAGGVIADAPIDD